MAIDPLTLSIATTIGKKVAEKGLQEIFAHLQTDKLDAKFFHALKQVSKIYEKRYPDVLDGNIEFFFRRKEVVGELFKLLFKNAVINNKVLGETFDVSSLPINFLNNFIDDLKFELLKDKEINDILSDRELYLLMFGLETNVNKITENSNLTVDEIRTIRTFLEKKLTNEFDVTNFLKVYSKNSINNLSQINFLGLGIDISINKKRKNLQDIFVTPSFDASNQVLDSKGVKGINVLRIEYTDIFKIKKNIIILGNPGAGKSLLIKSIICDILEKKECFETSENVLHSFPFRIELRKYLAYKKKYNCGIIGYLKILLNEEYQIQNINEANLDWLMKEHLCLVFFDGLDEIFNVKDKIEIKDDIINFHNVYRSVKSITTSRIIGYEEAKFPQDDFIELKINNFTYSKIQEYVEKWYSKEEENVEVRNKEISDFLRKKNTIDFELLSNPLLLSLIVILYRNNLKIPESKLDIYKSCTKTLVDKWDSLKDLDIDLDSKILDNKNKLFADLAHWQYTNLSSKNIDISYNKAKNVITSSIVEKLKYDEEPAENLSEKFMIYAQKRSIYFDNNFTHKTFLEYYTSYWIYTNLEKKYRLKERNELISEYIDKPFWFIVLELLFNEIDKDQADTEIIDGILALQIKKSKKSYPFILSIIHTLKNVSNSKKDEIIESALYLLLQNVYNKKYSGSIYEKIFYGLESLCRYLEFQHILSKLLVKYENDYPKECYLLFRELSFYFESKPDFNLDKMKPFALIDHQIFRLYSVYYNSDPNFNYINVVISFIETFGTDNFFESSESIYQGFSYSSVFQYYARNQFTSKSIDTFPENLERLLELNISFDLLFRNFISQGKYFTVYDFFEKLLMLTTHKNKDVVKIVLYVIYSATKRISFKKNIAYHRLKNLVNEYPLVQQVMNFKTSKATMKYIKDL